MRCFFLSPRRGHQRAEKAIKGACLSISTPLSTKNDPSLRWTGLLAEALSKPHGCRLISWMTGQFECRNNLKRLVVGFGLDKYSRFKIDPFYTDNGVCGSVRSAQMWAVFTRLIKFVFLLAGGLFGASLRHLLASFCHCSYILCHYRLKIPNIFCL